MFYVYILSSVTKTLYTGVTNDIARRMFEHKNGLVPGFTKMYKVDRLVYLEEATDIQAAIIREKQIKGWLRKKKMELIDSVNPSWSDLSEKL